MPSSSSTRRRTLAGGGIGIDDPADEPMAHDVCSGQRVYTDPLDIRQDLQGVPQARGLDARQVHLILPPCATRPLRLRRPLSPLKALCPFCWRMTRRCTS